MRQTLVLIPHEYAGLPLFGWGWLMIGLAIALIIRVAIAVRSGTPIGRMFATEGLMWGAAWVVIGFVLPMVELSNIEGEPVGLAIRGYGVMLLLGVVSAVALAAWRASRRGIDPDIIFSLAPWAFIGGIVGARLFYVIQYRDRFDTYAEMFQFTQGGLVVYGSFIGGGLAVVYYIIRHRLPLLTFGDVIVPCLFIGVFFGRIGCLMNGCCYGGRCEDHWAAIHFPPTSIVYKEQLRSGELVGIETDPATGRIESVAPDSLAAQEGIAAGSTLQKVDDRQPMVTAESAKIPAADLPRNLVLTVDGVPHAWTADQLPSKALPVYAAQILSSVSALVLCLTLCGLGWVIHREGAIMMLGFAGYAVVRFVLEWIRVDEGGQFGTTLTISQWISLVVFALSIAGLAFVYFRGPKNNVAPIQPSTG